MTRVRCNLEECTHCQWDDDAETFICDAEEIELYSQHCSYGGCDYGCEIVREEEEE